jgi:hypothetical protein
MVRSAHQEVQDKQCFDHAQHNAFGAVVIGKDLRLQLLQTKQDKLTQMHDYSWRVLTINRDRLSGK